MPIARFKGTIVEWNEARGFGFIQPAAGGMRVFCHITAFRNRSESPALDRVVVYEVGRDERGRPQAKRIQYADGPVANPKNCGTTGGPEMSGQQMKSDRVVRKEPG